MKKFRRILFFVLCVGIVLALIVESRSKEGTALHPTHEHYSLFAMVLPFCMLAWCVAFRRVEATLTHAGWYIAGGGILLSLYLVPIVT